MLQIKTVRTLINFKVSMQHLPYAAGVLCNVHTNFFKPISKFHIKIRVEDSHHFNGYIFSLYADPDPVFHSNADPDLQP